jgi:hypothetical protein
LLLVGAIGLTGCDWKPPDGSVIAEGAQISPEQKSKVRSFYADRVKKANKKAGRKR